MANEATINGVHVHDVQYGRTTRKSFARIPEVLEMPNLIEVQKKSYEWFLTDGLREVFEDVASITDYTGNLELSFIDYKLDDEPKYSVEECKARDATYACPLRVRMRLRYRETGEIKEQELFMGDFPKMTDSGTFIINGAERVIVSQIVRSPGVYYGMTLDKTDKPLLSATVIPYRGAWLEYETDSNDVFYVRIDKNRKIPITSFIRAIGVETDAEIIEMFGEDERILATLDKDPSKTVEEALIEIYKKLRPGEPPTVDSSRSLLNALFFDTRRYDISAVGRYKYNKKLNIARRLAGHTLCETVTDPMTGEIIAEEGTLCSRELANEIARRGVHGTIIEANDGTKVKVFGNGMVDMKDFVSFNPQEKCGIKEKVRFEVLKELLENAQTEGKSEDELIDALEGVDLLGIRSKTSVTRKVIDARPTLTAVGCFCIGTNQVDLEYAGKNGIAVFNAPYSNTRSVVELVIGDIICLMRRIPAHTHHMKHGMWDKSASGSHEVRGKTLGIIGYGNIGSQLSVVAEALGMRVLFYDIEEKLAMGNAHRCDTLNELLEQSDVVTLHVDGRKSNTGFFGEDQFEHMKQDAIFINLSRGFVADLDALKKHLDSGHLSGAAVDVFPIEPKKTGDEFLTDLADEDNMILTPHIGGSTLEAQKSIGQFVSQRLEDYWFKGSTMLSVNLPQITLSDIKSNFRIAHLHANLPGVLARVNRVLGEDGINIAAQALGTEGEIGYVVTDVAQRPDQKALDQLASIEGTIRMRVIS